MSVSSEASVQGIEIQGKCKSSSLPADTSSTDFSDPTVYPSIQACGDALIAIVDGCSDGTLSCQGSTMQAAYNGLGALQLLQQHSLTSSTVDGSMRQLYTHLSA